MTDTVLTYADACRMLGCRRRWLRVLVGRGDLQCTPTGRRLRNGHREMGVSRARVEIYMAGGGQSDPATRTGKAEMRAVGTPAGARGEEASALGGPTPASAGPLQLPLTLVHIPAHLPITRDGVPDVAGMRAAGMDGAVNRWDKRMAAIAKAESRLASAKHGERRAVLRRTADEHGVDPATLYRWIATKRDGGAASLVPSSGHRAGSRAIPPELQPQILEFYLDQRRPSFEQVYQHIVIPWFSQDGRACPHISTIRHFIRANVLPVAETGFREGPRALDAQIMPKVIRDWRTAGLNGWWVGDHRRWDVHIRMADGKVRRPWVSMITDVYSGAIVGWRICERPSAATVCHALREAILTFGPPANFLRDNGKEFVAMRLGGKPERLLHPRAGDLGASNRWPAAMGEEVEGSGIWATFGTTLHTAIPYHAWSKPIESTFHAFAADENLMPGWCGRSTERKPEQLKRQVKDDLLMLPAEFSDVFADRVQWWNTEHVVGDRPAPPLDMYKDHVARRPDPSTLAYLCQEERDARVEPEGIRLSGRYYRGEYLGIYTGAMLRVRWDPESPEHAYAYAPDGQVILLTPVPVAGWGEPGEALVIAKREGRRIHEYLAMVRARIRGATPIERLDPLGAYQMVADRKAEDARAAQVAALQPAIEGAAEQQLARAEHEQEHEEEEAPRRSIYSRIWEGEIGQ